MTQLRKFAALFVVSLVSFLPIILSSPSQAADSTYTLSDYNATVTAAQTAVTDAQAAVDSAQIAYDNSSTPVVTPTGSGVTVDVYNSYATRTPSANTLCRTTTFSQIANNWGNGSVAGCNNDHVVIHYYGTITVPDTGVYRFMNIADDGFYLTINGQVVINEWRDKGCGGAWGTGIQLTADTSYVLDGWFYENGGGACSTLYVMQPSGNWQLTPANWFGATSTITYEKDPALLAVLNQKKADLQTAQDVLAAIPAMNIPAPTDLVATVSGGSVTLTWNAPTTGLVPERYAVMWTVPGNNGWGVASMTTSIVLPDYLFSSTGGWDTDYTFSIRSDQDTAHMYSAYSNAVTVHLSDPTPPVVVVIPPAPVETATTSPDSTTVTDSQTVLTPPQDTSTVQSPVVQETQTVVETSTVDSQTVTPSEPIDQAPELPVTPPAVPVEPSLPPAPAPQPVEVPAPAPDPAPEPEPEPAPAPAPDPAPEPAPDPAPAPDPQPEPAPDPAPAPAPDPAPVPAPEPAPDPAPIPEPKPDPAPETPVVEGLVPNNPDSLPDDIPKEAPAEVLVPHEQVDKPGVENGGIEFFGTKSQPQVVGEDGKLTPPAPPPGSGLPIPPDAITTTATFIGQPGGTTFNAPDIAVPVPLVPLEGAIAAIPGAEQLNKAFNALQNIGNDMSPVTRKKAKKILVITVALAAIGRRFK